MYPSDEWLETLQFYLIVASGGRLLPADFSDEVLYAAWREQPGMTYAALVPVAEKLVLEFQAKEQDTEAKNSPIGEKEFLPNGSVRVSMFGVSGDVREVRQS